MKTFITAIFVIFASASFAETFSIDEKSAKKCPGMEIDGSTLLCTKAKYYSAVLEAKVGTHYKGPGLDVIGENDMDVVWDLGILPDADTSGIYNYVRYLRDSNNTHVGYMLIEGWMNSEMDVKYQVNKRLNILGKVVKVTVEDK